MREIRSPWTLTRDMPHAQRGISPGSRSSPSNARADWVHAAPHIGKSGPQPASARRDAVLGRRRRKRRAASAGVTDREE